MRFRRGVSANRHTITPMCQVLLLRLSVEMSDKCIVSIPRSRLGEEFGCALPRVTEWMNQAREAGFLSIVRRGRPGVTAVYQGLYVGPTEVLEGVPTTRYAEPDHVGVREGVPQDGVTKYALPHTQEVTTNAAIGADPSTHLGQRGKEEPVS